MNGARRNAMAAGGAAKERLCRATGGRVDHAMGGSAEIPVDGAPGRSRSDRAARNKDNGAGKGTTVNVIVAPKAEGAAASPTPSVSPAAGIPPSPPPRPPMMPPGAPSAAGGPPPGMMPRATGGRVTKPHGDEAQDRALFNKMFREQESKPHREGRAKGGRTKPAAGMESAAGRASRPRWTP